MRSFTIIIHYHYYYYNEKIKATLNAKIKSVWYRNVFKRRPKVSRDDAIDQTGKTTAISVTMLITIAKTVSDGFGGRLAFAASMYVCPLKNDGQPSSMLDRDWGGRSRPPRHKFSVTSVGVIFNQWGG